MTPDHPFEAFVAPARRRPALWRLVLGLIVSVLVCVLWFVAMYLGLRLIFGAVGAGELMFAMAEPVTPSATLLLLATFIGFALAPMVAAPLLHRRRPRTLFGPRAKLWSHFTFGCAAVAGVYAISTLFWTSGFDGTPNLSPGLWLSLLPLALLLILIQTGAEEMLFRGYLMQQLAARFRRRWVFILVPALIFGALHFDPTSAGVSGLLIALSATVFGLVAADLTYATGSLGAAWGLHFANNVFAILGVSTKGTITGLALYVTPYSADVLGEQPGLVLLDLLGLVVIWGLLRWRLTRR